MKAAKKGKASRQRRPTKPRQAGHLKSQIADFRGEIDGELLARIFAAYGRTFDGEIWEDAPDVAMGKGYANEGKPFDITTAHYLKPVFRAIRNPLKRKIVLRAAVQTLKTFTTEKSASYFAVHEPGDMVLYDCDAEAARDHAKSRLKPFLDSIPGLADQIAEIADRHDVSTREYYLPGMTLRIWPLNESSTQRITLRYVIIHDAFLSKKTGLIGHAIARTTQHPHDKKIIIESQGSDEGDDFDLQYQTTDQATLFVKCPLCRSGQPFAFETFRAEDFAPAAGTYGPGGSFGTHELPKPGSYSGFQRGPDSQVLLPDGRYDAAAIKRLTYYECYHCGGSWQDEPGTRLALDESSYYVPENPGADPVNAGFHWPNWINQRVKWGGEDVMLGYLNAKRADRELGNRDDFKQWWQKRAALTWREDVGTFTGRISDSIYDPKKPMADEAVKFCIIDVQDNLEHFWVQVWAVDKFSNVRMLHHEHARHRGSDALPSGQVEGEKSAMTRVEEIIKEWEVPVNCVGIDGQHEMERVVEWAAKNRYIGPIIGKNGRVTPNAVLTWRVLSGNKADEFRWKDGRRKRYDQGFKGLGNRYPVKVMQDGRPLVAFVLHNNISTLRYADIAKRFRDQKNAPKLEILPSIAAQQGPDSYNEQMFSEYRGTADNGKPIWKKKSSSVHNHAWDCFKMLLAMMDIRGLLSLQNDDLDEVRSAESGVRNNDPKVKQMEFGKDGRITEISNDKFQISNEGENTGVLPPGERMPAAAAADPLVQALVKVVGLLPDQPDED
jgi:hypothetical protein